MTIIEQMLMIKAIDRSAHLELSEVTGKWYVVANLDEGGDGVLCGIVEHRSTPELAVEAFFKRLLTVPFPKYIVADAGGKRKGWRWNGACFAECA